MVCKVLLCTLQAALLEARERSDRRPHASGCYPLAFSFCVSANKKKRGISFENEEGLKGNARICLYSEKVECLHGNTGGFTAHGLHRY